MERGQRPGFLLETQRDRDWLDEAIAWQWKMPKKAGPFWRRRGIRHIRSALLVAKAYIFIIPTVPDWQKLWYREWHAYAIRRGWC
jgi:hypothetical protein